MRRALFFIYPLAIVFLINCDINCQVDPENISSLLEKANNYQNVNHDSTIFFSLKALKLVDRKKDTSLQFDIYRMLIPALMKVDRFSEAIEHCRNAIEKSKENNLINDQIDFSKYYGVIYQLMGLSNEALEFLLETKVLVTESGESDKEAILEYYIGSVYEDIGEIDKCRKHLNKSISLFEGKHNPQQQFNSFLLLSNTYDQIDSIKYYLGRAEEIILENPHLQYEKLVILNNKALLNEALGDLKQSKAEYLQAIRIAENQGYKSYLANLYNNYAYLLMAESKMDSVKIVLQKGLIIARFLDNLDLEASILDTYSDYFEEISNYSLALMYQDSSNAKRDEYRNNQQIQQSLFLSVVFETEQKEKEIVEQESKINRFQAIIFGTLAFTIFLIAIIVYYRQKYTIRKARLVSVEREKSLEVANALIEGQDTERKRLAMDLHDGLGARLGTLRFKLDNYLEGTPYYNEITKDVNGIGENIRALSHRMLPSQLEELGLVVSLQNLFHSLSKSDVFIVELETDIEERLTLQLETNLYYLVFELINNALKHSGGNKIFVQLIKHDNNLSLSVEDNGIGFDTKKSSEGLGLKNIKQRVAYLQGYIHIDVQPNHGTIFMIEIPI